MRNEPLTPESVQLIIDYMTKKRSHHKPSQQLFRELAELLDRPVHTIANVWHREQRKIHGSVFESELKNVTSRKREYPDDYFDPHCDLRAELMTADVIIKDSPTDRQTSAVERYNITISGHGRTRMMF